MNVNEQNTFHSELADILQVSNMSPQRTRTTQSKKQSKSSIERAFIQVSRILTTLLLLGLSTFAFGQVTVDFNYTGAAQNWVVPAGVSSVTIDVWGAQGENSTDGTLGGNGGYATGVLSVTPGETLNIYVGQTGLLGTGGFNGGGNGSAGGDRGAGGGASDVRQGGNTLADRVIVAGGGGGAGNIGRTGGDGGGTVGEDGFDDGNNDGPGGGVCDSGEGGTQTTGGASVDSQAGSLGQGGNSINPSLICSGGGGGYYGGGSGNGAGGGSSYIDGVTGGSTTGGLRTGNGFVQVTFVSGCDNESYSCDDEVTITLGDAPACEALVEPDDVLNNLDPIDASCFEITLTDSNGDPLVDGNGDPLVPANLVTADYIGEEVFAMVMNTATGQMKCMGIIINVVDGSDPVITCPDDDAVVCGESTDPAETGEATAEDCSDVTVDYEDSVVMEDCESGLIKTITRTWTATDANGKSVSCDQTIEVERLYADDFTLPDNAEVACNAGMPNTDPTDDGAGYPTGPDGQNVFDIAEDCGIWVSYTDADLIPESCAGFNIIKRTWMVMDTCDTDMTMGIQLITIVDNVDPIVSCPPNDTISVVQDSCFAFTTLHDVEVIEECSGYTIEYTADNGTIVGDQLIDLPLGTTTVTVTVTDGCGNSAEREYEIEVEDQIAPVAICETVHSVSLTDSEPTNVPAFVFDDGSYDNCSDVTFQVRRMEADSCDFDDATDFGNYAPFYCCDVGDTIMVELKVTDAAGNMNFCMVDVYVDDKLDPEITCPANIEISCNESIDPSNTGEPIVSDNCEIDSVSYVDDDVIGCGGGTIVRTWTVVDIHGNSASCDQTIVSLPGDPFVINDTDCTDADDSDGVIWPCAVYGLTACGTSGGAPTPDELIDLGYTDAEVNPQILANSCIEDYIVVGYEDSAPITGTNICVKYLRTWTVLNCCDPNHIVVGTYNQLIEISSTDAPVYTCDGIATVFEGEESIIQIAPTDDCTALDDLEITWEIYEFSGNSIDHAGSDADASGFYPAGIHTIIWSVTDLCGNSTPCITTFEVSPLAPPDYAIVSGEIQNEEGAEVEYVNVAVSGDMNDEEETTETGAFEFELPMHNNYAVTPERDDNPLNGVTTYDLVKISQHILEVDLLNTPYKIIAADVNNSGTVTAVDLVELRKLILFIDSEFSNNSSWRFVDADFVFPNPQDPFETSFPEIFTINDLEVDEQANFVAIKIGDVNTSSSPNDLTGSADDRNNGKELSFTAMDQKLIAGERYTVDFNINEVSKLQGYQFTLSFDPTALALENLIPGELEGISEANFGLHLLNEGVITTSYHNMAMMDAKQATSFSITFEALTDVQLSEVIAINSRYTKAQAYINNESSDVNLTFESENGIAVNDFQLFQNRPNPFKGETVISFNLPEGNAGTLTVYDLSGRVLKQVQAEFNAGYNEVNISSADLIGHGVYYYRLEVEDHQATRKMVLLK